MSFYFDILFHRYPKYKVLNNDNYTRSAEKVEERRTEYGKLGILHDIHMLSKCDYVICTFSSNVRCIFFLSLSLLEGGGRECVHSATSLTAYFNFLKLTSNR